MVRIKCGKLKSSQEMDEWIVVGDKSLHHCLPRSHVGSEFDYRPAHEEVEVRTMGLSSGKIKF